MAAGDPGTRKRNYSATAIETTLVNSITSAATGDTTSSVAVVSVSGFPTTLPYTLIIDPDGSKEEVVTVTAASSTTLTITRGQDSTTAFSHAAGTSVRHGISAREFRELQTHISARGYDADSAILSGVDTHVHGLITGEGAIVGSTQAVTLTRKTLGTGTTIASTVDMSSGTISGGTLTSPTISGSPVITGLSSVGMSTSSAAPKSYVDGLITTNSAYATAAATSATSAATSATASASSASAAATSASSAATSASSAATSATASASSASAAATSASSAATSATSAAASATTASNSAATATTQANNASASATAAATSATSAAASATAAATSATSAATSASSALTSQSAAATSATSAATSASSAATTYTAYDVRYLGAKASAPTVDNQGGALITGATYWNSTANVMYVWSGSAWSAVSTANGAVTTGTLAQFAATTSAQLAGVISDETGSGALVFATSPTLTTPNLGTPSAINLTNATNTPTDATKANLASPTFTGTVTIPTGAVITSPKIGSTYSAKTAAYTFASGDEGNIFSMNNAASVQFNIPTDATFNFAVGTEINVFWITGAGQPTIGAVTPGTTTVISTGGTSATPKLRVANSGATCKKIAANSWIVFGDLS